MELSEAVEQEIQGIIQRNNMDVIEAKLLRVVLELVCVDAEHAGFTRGMNWATDKAIEVMGPKVE